ncbi:MAG TPA: TauD/TfdA family dioxygenase [Burkholderiales bacterium]|nr:TauD/TfdA family dioxygenase [Burkholderiales bacterium]
MPIEILPINGFIGAEIRGVSLARLDDATFQALHDALVKYEVIVLRRQDITLEDQMAFGARFGELSIHPFSPNLEDKPQVMVLDYSEDHPAARTDIWHADETFRAAPPMATMLRARVVPAQGGDTCFSSMTAAYRGLSERMKRHIHGLEALHDFKPFRSLFNGTPEHRRKLRELEDQFPNPWHPVVSVHPVTGRRAIYVNPQFTVRIRGLKEDESSALLDFLYAQASVPEYQLRVKWEVDTVVMWDNRSVQHYAPHDYYPERRKMERVTITGDVPAGVPGEYTPETVEGLGQVNPSEPPRKPPVRQFERTR